MSLLRRHHGLEQRRLPPLLLLAMMVFIFTLVSHDSTTVRFIHPEFSTKHDVGRMAPRKNFITSHSIYNQLPSYIDIISSNVTTTASSSKLLLPMVIDTISMGHKQTESGRLTLQSQKIHGSRQYQEVASSLAQPKTSVFQNVCRKM